jgi:hypothetical protein
MLDARGGRLLFGVTKAALIRREPLAASAASSAMR